MNEKTQRETGVQVLRRAFPDAGLFSLWQQRVGASTLEAIEIGRIIVIVQQFDAGGWEAFMPATASNRIDATIDAIGKAAGIAPVTDTTA